MVYKELFKNGFQTICLAEDSISNMMVANQMLNKLPMEYLKYQHWDHFSLLYTLMTFQEHPTTSIIFADDTSVFIEGTHLEQMIHIINEDLPKKSIPGSKQIS